MYVSVASDCQFTSVTWSFTVISLRHLRRSIAPLSSNASSLVVQEAELRGGLASDSDQAMRRPILWDESGIPPRRPAPRASWSVTGGRCISEQGAMLAYSASALNMRVFCVYVYLYVLGERWAGPLGEPNGGGPRARPSARHCCNLIRQPEPSFRRRRLLVLPLRRRYRRRRCCPGRRPAVRWVQLPGATCPILPLLY